MFEVACIQTNQFLRPCFLHFLKMIAIACAFIRFYLLLCGESDRFFNFILEFGLRKFIIQESKHSRAFNGIDQVYIILLLSEFLQAQLHSTENGCLQHIASFRPHIFINCQAHSNQVAELIGIMRRNGIIISDNYFSIKSWEIFGSEWRMQSAHFVEETASGPDITFSTVLFPFPDFRACIIRCACLGRTHSVFQNLRHVQITQFCNTVDEKYIGTLDVSVHNSISVQNFQSLEQLKSNFPNEGLLEPLSMVLLESCIDFTLEISAVSVFHDYAKILVLVVKKGSLVADYIRYVNRGQQPDLIECTIFLLLIESSHIDRFNSIKFLIGFFANELHFSEASTAQIFDDIEIFKTQVIVFHQLMEEISFHNIYIEKTANNLANTEQSFDFPTPALPITYLTPTSIGLQIQKDSKIEEIMVISYRILEQHNCVFPQNRKNNSQGPQILINYWNCELMFRINFGKSRRG